MSAAVAGPIVSVGARAALGLNALQVAMSVRAGLSEPRACQFKTQRDQRIGMCRVGGIGGDVFGYDRLLALAAPALSEAVAGRDVAGYALVISLPAALRPDDDPRFATSFAADLCGRAKIAIEPKRVSVIRTGHAGGAEAMIRGAELLNSCPGVVVGGVDSYYHRDVLTWLDEAYRLHALGIDDGFIPGEGAAFVLLGGGERVARMVAAHAENEPAMLDESQPNIASALTSAVKNVNGTDAPWVMYDVNGEHPRQREWSMVSLRHGLGGGHLTRLPNELGDIGAATVPMMAAIATTWWRYGCAPAARALLLASSETAERAALVLEEVPS